MQQIGRDDGRVHAAAEAAQVGARGLHDDDGLVAEVATRAAEGLGHRRAQQPLLAGLAPGVALHQAGGAPAGRARCPAFGEEARGGLLQQVVLFAHPGRGEEGQGHGRMSSGWERA